MLQQTIVWMTFCTAAVGTAVAWPRFARHAFGWLFIVMALAVNVVLVIVAPARFVGLGTDAALVSVYAWAFQTVVAAAPVAFGLTVAACEVLVGALMIRGGRSAEVGLLGGIAFLVASAPLGVWALPNLILTAGLTIVMRASRTTQSRSDLPTRRQRGLLANHATPALSSQQQRG
jgi:hypothetical protein